MEGGNMNKGVIKQGNLNGKIIELKWTKWGDFPANHVWLPKGKNLIVCNAIMDDEHWWRPFNI